MGSGQSLSTLSDALFGRLAVRAGLLTERQLSQLIGERDLRRQAGTPASIGDLCRERAWIAGPDLERLKQDLAYEEARREDKVLARAALRKRVVGQAALAAALELQKSRHGADPACVSRLMEILLEQRALDTAALGVLLGELRRLEGSAGDVDTAVEFPPPPACPPPAAGGGAAPVAWLVQEAGPGAGRVFALGQVAILGRVPICEVPLPDALASRRHARLVLEADSGTHIAEDLGSRNRTLLNEAPLDAPRPLRAGDLLRIGDSVLRYVRAVPGEPPPPAAAPPPDAHAGLWAALEAGDTRVGEESDGRLDSGPPDR